MGSNQVAISDINKKSMIRYNAQYDDIVTDLVHQISITTEPEPFQCLNLMAIN